MKVKLSIQTIMKIVEILINSNIVPIITDEATICSSLAKRIFMNTQKERRIFFTHWIIG